jgi:hypothetical protein
MFHGRCIVCIVPYRFWPEKLLQSLLTYCLQKHLLFYEESLQLQLSFVFKPIIGKLKLKYSCIFSALHAGRSGEGLYGDVLREMDEGVGQILNKIRQLGPFSSRQFSARIFLQSQNSGFLSGFDFFPG